MKIETRLSGGYLIFLLGITTLATTIYATWSHFSPVPYADQWDGTIGFYLRALQSPWQAFFEQHNEHRLTFSRLLFFVDMHYFGGRNVLLLIANLVLAAFLAMAFYRVSVKHAPPRNWGTRAGLIGLILIFVFSWVQQENFSWGFQSQWFAANLFSLLAFHLLELAGDAHQRGTPSECDVFLAMALLSGSVAAFSMASGLLVFPILIAQTLYLRIGWRVFWLIFAMTAAVWIAYFFNWHNPSSGPNLLTTLREHPIDALQYILLYLGAPAHFLSPGELNAYAGGAIVLLTFTGLTIKAWRSRIAVHTISLLAFSFYVIGNALITAGGRLSIGVEQAFQSRYTTASLAAWLALIIFAALNIDSKIFRKYVLIMAAVVTLFVASGQRLIAESNLNVMFNRLFAGLALRSHVYDPTITSTIYPILEPLIIIANAAEQAEVSIFSPNQPDYFSPPAHINASSNCDGYIDTIAETRTPGIYHAEGWIFDAGEERVPRDVVVTDADGTTLGTGITGSERNDVRDIKGPNARYSGWRALFQAPALITAQIVAPTGKGSYCKLQVPRTVRTTNETLTQ